MAEKYIKICGKLVAVTEEVYYTYYHMGRQRRTQAEKDGRRRIASYDALDTDDAEALTNLNKAGWRVDCVLTHCAPTGILGQIDPSYQPDPLTEFLESVRQRCRFQYWFFGHYHTNKIIDSKYILQWEQISQLQ